jgi:hypothetical protein
MTRLRLRIVTVAAVVTLTGLLGLTPASGAAGTQVVVTLSPAHRTTVAPGEVAWTVRIRNASGQTLTGLRLAETVVVHGDPGHSATASFAGRACEGAAGTLYCPLPVLRPGAEVSGRRLAEVPASFPGGSSNLGALLETTDAVVTSQGVAASNRVVQSLRIERTSLPYTGSPVETLASVAALCIVLGGAMVGRREVTGGFAASAQPR